MHAPDFRLYLVTNRALSPAPLEQRVATLIEAGVRSVLLREKDLDGRELLRLASSIASIAQACGARFFVNERADVALACGAQGIHAGEASWSAEELREIAPNLLMGKSTHSLEAAMEAERSGASFITFGPIYETPAKMQYGAPQGLAKLREITKSISIPVYAIGGITPQRAAECMEAGAFGVAVMSDLLASPSPAHRVDEYRSIIGAL